VRAVEMHIFRFALFARRCLLKGRLRLNRLTK